MHDDLTEELASLAAIARELVEWEQGLGGDGVPAVTLEIVEPREAAEVDSKAPPRAVPASVEPRVATRVASIATGPRARPSRIEPRDVSAVEIVEPPAAPDPTASREPARSTPEERRVRLAQLAEEAATCTRCVLHRERTKSVFARGSLEAEIVFVGEGPGYHEDRLGAPFVGPAGELLDRMVAAMGYGRDDVYVCNVVKCRPPENRTPQPNEAALCAPYLEGQIAAVAPRVIVALGRCAAESLGLCAPGERGWRGRWSTWNGLPAMATYHPAFLLRSPEMKRPVWEDLRQVLGRLGRTPPSAR